MHINELFVKSLDAICPVKLVQGQLANFDWPADKKLHLVGFGKAAAGMATGLLGFAQFASVTLSVPFGTQEQMTNSGKAHLYPDHPSLRIFEVAENNLPDDGAVTAAAAISQVVEQLTDQDALIVCCSGGGSACLSAPIDGLCVAEKTDFIKFLTRQGATIDELNIIRARLSKVKGGQLLAAAVNCARVHTFILSDIINSPVHLIGSGPTVPRVEDGSIGNLIQKYRIGDYHCQIIKEALLKELPVLEYPENHGHTIIGENRLILEQVASLWAEKTKSTIISDQMDGTVDQIAKSYIELIKQFRREAPIMLILGGEPTVNICGTGRGGRNQQLVHEMLQLHLTGAELKGVQFLSGGTDGQDGPCPVAGAWLDFDLVEMDGETCQAYLANNDSYNFFSTHLPDNLVTTGLTFTNVMDVHLILIK